MMTEEETLTVELERVNAALEEERSIDLAQLIVFKLGDEEYALPIDQIKEVVLTPKISKIPQTPEYVKGVANIRGNVIAIVDLELKFGMIEGEEIEILESDDTEPNYTLVIDSEEYSVGIIVQEVPNTLSVPVSKIDSTSNIIQHSSLSEDSIKGIIKLDDRMVMKIDILAMMETGDIRSTLE